MKNLYFKLFICLLYFFCFSANIASGNLRFTKARACQTEKTNERSDILKDNIKEDLIVDSFFQYHPQLNYIVSANQLRGATFRFQLPLSCKEIPDRPPKL